MEKQIGRLAHKIQNRLAALPPDERLLIAISGIPGSGKTTLAALVASRLNATQDASSVRGPNQPLAAFVPMDGYHLTRKQLDTLPNPEEAHARRGAEFTFDGQSFLELVRAVRSQKPLSDTIYAPSFDHAKKDPVFNDIPILASARVIIFEGLYLSLDKGPWKEAGELMDEMWFVEVSYEKAVERLIERHVTSGIAENAAQAKDRAENSDMRNGKEIVNDRLPRDKITELVISKEDDSWKPTNQSV